MVFDYSMHINDQHQQFIKYGLSRKDLHADPMKQFELWYQQAEQAEIRYPNAMSLVSVHGKEHLGILVASVVDRDHVERARHPRSNPLSQARSDPGECTDLVFFFRQGRGLERRRARGRPGAQGAD